MVRTDTMHVIHARAAGLDVHKMQIAATVRVAHPGTEAEVFTRQFSALPSGLAALVDWLRTHAVSAAVMEGTGIYWEAPWQALEHAGIKALLVHAQHVKQLRGRKTDIADSVWLARICQFGLCAPSLVPPAQFRTLRKVSRMRRQVVRERARTRNRIHQVLDAAGVRVGGILSDLFGANGTRILEGLSARTLCDGAVVTVLDGRRPRTGTMGAGCRMAVKASLRPRAAHLSHCLRGCVAHGRALRATRSGSRSLPLLRVRPGTPPGTPRVVRLRRRPAASARRAPQWR